MEFENLAGPQGRTHQDILAEKYASLSISKMGLPESFKSKGYYSYLTSGQYSDLTVRDKEGRDWHVHKLVVCAGCQFFANAVKGGFKEAETNVVELPNDDPAAVEALLTYIYAEDYLWLRDQCPPEAAVLHHIEVYIIADLYDIPGLKDLAFQRIVARVGVVGGCPRTLILLAARRVYASLPESDRRLRDLLAFLSSMHLPGLMCNPLYQHIITEFDAFSIDIAKALLKNPEQIECPSCRSYVETRSKEST